MAKRSGPEFGEVGFAKAQGFHNPARLVAAATGGSRVDAQRLIAVGVATAERQAFSGERMPARHPHVAAALRSANLNPAGIGHINAHGVGMPDVDMFEAQAILDVFGADAGRKIPVTALKSFLGNSGAGSGLLELAGSIVGLSQGVIPFTINYDTPDPACPVNVVAKEPRSTKNRIVLNANVTRVGQASAAIVEVY